MQRVNKNDTISYYRECPLLAGRNACQILNRRCGTDEQVARLSSHYAYHMGAIKLGRRGVRWGGVGWGNCRGAAVWCGMNYRLRITTTSFLYFRLTTARPSFN